MSRLFGPAWLAVMVLWAVVGAGCGKAPDSDPAATAQVSQQQYDARIKAIEADPGMSPEAKQRAIAVIKQQQASAATQGQTKP